MHPYSLAGKQKQGGQSSLPLLPRPSTVRIGGCHDVRPKGLEARLPKRRRPQQLLDQYGAYYYYCFPPTLVTSFPHRIGSLEGLRKGLGGVVSFSLRSPVRLDTSEVKSASLILPAAIQKGAPESPVVAPES